jgi:hypothetical protein
MATSYINSEDAKMLPKRLLCPKKKRMAVMISQVQMNQGFSIPY